MNFAPLVMGRLQSTWENRVAWNLSESAHPLKAEGDADELPDTIPRGAVRAR
jgi:hypothetical protein